MIGTPVLIAVEFAGISQHCAAWQQLNGEDLFQPHPDRGENLVRPGFGGRLGQPFHRDEMSVDLRYLFDGNADPDGDPHANPVHGLAANKRAFREDVFEAAPDAQGCVTCTAVDVDGVEYVGAVQMRRLRWGQGDLYHCPAVLTVVLPDPLELSSS